MLKFLIVLDALGFVLLTYGAVLNAGKGEDALTVVLSLLALCLAALGIQNYRTLRSRGR